LPVYKPRMELLETVDEVIDALGGTTATGRIAIRSPQSVTNWRNAQKLPCGTFLRLNRALEAIGKKAPPELWGMEE
jgi:hypothetical protein